MMGLIRFTPRTIPVSNTQKKAELRKISSANPTNQPIGREIPKNRDSPQGRVVSLGLGFGSHPSRRRPFGYVWTRRSLANTSSAIYP